MPLLGAHMSIAGGLPRAVDRAEASRCEALQIFTKSTGQWRARVLPPEEIALFRRRLEETGIHPVVAHNSYLINLAAADPALRAQSIDALGEELDRAEALGLHGLVMHPGSYTTGSEAEGLELIARALAVLLRARPRAKTMILLEHTAGQGTNLGHRFEHLADDPGASPRIPACRCLPGYLPSAGGWLRYLLGTGLRATFEELDRLVGLDRVRVFHLNDSKKPCGSRVDRHEHIGKGCLGLEPFRRLLNDRRFDALPMLLETPKLETPESRRRSDADPWDLRNLRTLRRLLSPASRAVTKRPAPTV